MYNYPPAFLNQVACHAFEYQPRYFFGMMIYIKEAGEVEGGLFSALVFCDGTVTASCLWQLLTAQICVVNHSFALGIPCACNYYSTIKMSDLVPFADITLSCKDTSKDIFRKLFPHPTASSLEWLCCMQRLLAAFSSCGKDEKKELFRQAKELLCDPEPKIITNEVSDSCELPDHVENVCVCV